MVTVQNDCVEFSFFRPHAKSVFLAGDFNEWRPDQVAMTRGHNGYWHARVKLDAGDYKFRYCADGVWYTDFAAFGVEPGSHGFDSVLHVAPKTIQVAPPAQRQVAAA